MSEPYDNPFWENEKEPREKEKERERKKTLIVATYILPAAQGQRTHSARTKIMLQKQLIVLIFTEVGIKCLKWPDKSCKNLWWFLIEWLGRGFSKIVNCA